MLVACLTQTKLRYNQMGHSMKKRAFLFGVVSSRLMIVSVLLLACDSLKAQLPAGHAMKLYRQVIFGLFQPPNDSSAMFDFLWDDRTVWDFSKLDTSAWQTTAFSKIERSAFIPGANVRECRNDGDVIHYWLQQDSLLLYRGAAAIRSPTKACEEEWQFDIFGTLYENSERFPSPTSSLWSSDEFAYVRFQHTAGTAYTDKTHTAAFREEGVKVLDRKSVGTLITPLDTFYGSLFIREKGMYIRAEHQNGRIDTFDLVKGYWYHPISSYPIAIAYEWLRPLIDTTGHQISQLIEVQVTHRQDNRLAREEPNDCRLFPNPFVTCFEHEFEEIENI